MTRWHRVRQVAAVPGALGAPIANAHIGADLTVSRGWFGKGLFMPHEKVCAGGEPPAAICHSEVATLNMQGAREIPPM